MSKFRLVGDPHHGNKASHDHDDDFDSWLLDDGSGYELKKFYTRSIDSKGHKEVCHVSVPPMVYGQISELVASKDIAAYRTPQDFVRDAIVHRLHWLATARQNGKLEQVVGHERFLCDMAQMQEEIQSIKKAVDDLKTFLDQAMLDGDYNALDRAIERGQDQIDSLREPYKTTVKVMLRQAKIELHRMKK